jgi:tripartite-type tricarboxylate transporter receptor subunit TctC
LRGFKNGFVQLSVTADLHRQSSRHLRCDRDRPSGEPSWRSAEAGEYFNNRRRNPRASGSAYRFHFPSLGVSTLPQLIALAKKNPGKISIAVTGIGRLTHLTGEVLQQRAGIKLLTVPYTGGPAAALGDVGSGRVSMIIEGYSGMVGAVKAKQVKLIAVATTQRLPQFSDLPTVAETLPGFSATGWQVLLAPLGTPQPIRNTVSGDLTKIVTDADFKKRLANVGTYSRAMTPEEVITFVKKGQETWLPVLQRIAAK